MEWSGKSPQEQGKEYVPDEDVGRGVWIYIERRGMALGIKRARLY